MNTNRQQTLFRLTCAALIMTFGMLMPACGGGGSDNGGGVTNPLVARFIPDNDLPGDDTINMAGSSAGSNVAVEIQVTEILDFAAAAFSVTYDPATVRFTGFDPDGLLDNFAGATDVTAVESDPANLGTIIVYATIQDLSQPAGIDVVGTEKLLTLNFQATTTIAMPGNAIEFVSPQDVQICPAPAQACNDVSGAVTWDGGSVTASR